MNSIDLLRASITNFEYHYNDYTCGKFLFLSWAKRQDRALSLFLEMPLLEKDKYDYVQPKLKDSQGVRETKYGKWNVGHSPIITLYFNVPHIYLSGIIMFKKSFFREYKLGSFHRNITLLSYTSEILLHFDVLNILEIYILSVSTFIH